MPLTTFSRCNLHYLMHDEILVAVQACFYSANDNDNVAACSAFSHFYSFTHLRDISLLRINRTIESLAILVGIGIRKLKWNRIGFQWTPIHQIG
jgi:hypothetical protein